MSFPESHRVTNEPDFCKIVQKGFSVLHLGWKALAFYVWAPLARSQCAYMNRDRNFRV